MAQRQPVHEFPATPLFAGVEDDDWPDLLGSSTRRDFVAGESVFREGEDADSFFVVLAGLVEVRTRPKAGAAEQPIAHLGPGAVLGETSLFVGGQHSASIFAKEPSTLLQFRNQGFRDMIQSRHRGAIQVLFNIGNTLAVRLRSADAPLAGGAPTSPSASFIGNANKARRIIPAEYS